MARFAGYVRRNPGDDDVLRRGLASIGDAARWQVATFGPVALAHDPKFTTLVRHANRFALLSGSLLVSGADSDEADLRRLCEHDAGSGAGSSGSDLDAFLRTCRGNFSLVLGDQGGRRAVRLISDALATQPLYTWEDARGRGFAGQAALAWSFGQLDPNAWNHRALVEQIAFKFPLGERTDHPALSVLDHATVLDLGADTSNRRHYWRWRQSRPDDAPIEEHARAIYEAFQSAVAVRIARHGARDCLLSAGMDSRMIAVELRRHGEAPLFHNFGTAQTLDATIPERLAEAWGAQLNYRNFDLRSNDSVGGGGYLRARVLHDYYETANGTALPVWSGDGGSVCLGGVYLDEELIAARDAGESDRAIIRRFLDRNSFGVPSILLSRSAKCDVARMIEGEIDSYGCPDVLSALMHFLVVNNQRRHLWDHYNQIENFSTAIITPFFDPLVLQAVDACPVEWIMGHRVYTTIFQLLPAEARAIGWQTYPGHQPSTVPVRVEGEYQWNPRRAFGKTDDAALRARARAIISTSRSAYWPTASLHRIRTSIAAAVVLAGFHRYRHYVNKADRVVANIAVRERWMNGKESGAG